MAHDEIRVKGEQTMAEAEAPSELGAEPPPAWQARRLLRAARMATLATVADGQPFAALVTPACTADLSPLLLLSSLSEHTRQLLAEPRCALLVSGTPAERNPQTAPRVTLLATAERLAEPGGMKAQYLAIHPYAALYADFGDFSLWRLRPERANLVGGFARAHRIPAGDLLPDAAAVAAVAAAAAAIMAHCNADHADTLALLAGEAGDWAMVAVDVDGCDLASGEIVRRIDWPAPVADADGVRAALIRAARAARKQVQGETT